jgi:multicomponent Na+:H+ antiporter subunit A
VVAASVGTFVAGFGLVAAGAREGGTVAEEIVERALPEGGGRNVVNVVLTDIRALDTLGEITVLAVAALGIATLVLARRPAAGEVDDGAA